MDGEFRRVILLPDELIERWFSGIFREPPEEMITAGKVGPDDWRVIWPFHIKFDAWATYYYENIDKIDPDLTTNKQWLDVVDVARSVKGQLKVRGWE